MIWVQVYYLDAVHGGSGFTRMNLEEVIAWLAARPGYLIRRIERV